MTTVQSSWTAEPAPGRPGQIANLANCRVDSRAVETADGIGFGLAVSQGSNDNGCILGSAAASGTFVSTTFVGITVNDIFRYPPDATHTDEYAQNDVAGVLSDGDIWVSPDNAVVDGANVTFNRLTGRLSSAAAAEDQPSVPGARWMTTAAANGIAKVRLTGQLGVA